MMRLYWDIRRRREGLRLLEQARDLVLTAGPVFTDYTTAGWDRASRARSLDQRRAPVREATRAGVHQRRDG